MNYKCACIYEQINYNYKQINVSLLLRKQQKLRRNSKDFRFRNVFKHITYNVKVSTKKCGILLAVSILEQKLIIIFHLNL